MALAVRPIADLDALARLAQDGGPGIMDATLLAEAQMLSDMPAHIGSLDASTAMILELLPRAADATAQAVASILSPLSQTPGAVLEALFARGGKAAMSVIRNSPWLPQEIRSAAIQSKEEHVLSVFAARPDLTTEEAGLLIASAAPSVLAVVAVNRKVALDDAQQAFLLKRARTDADLAQGFLRRPEIDCAILLPLYPHADAMQRQELREKLAIRIAERGVKLKEPAATEAERERLLEISMLGIASLIAEVATIANRGAGFVAAAAADPTRDVLSLALVALDIPSTESIRMLLRTGDDIAQDSRILAIAVDTLRNTPRDTANAILATCWPRGGAEAKVEQRPAQHVPVMAPGGTPSRAPATVGQPQKLGRPSEVIERLRNQR